MLQEELPWKQLYEMAVVCCRHRKLRGFSEQLLGELEKLIPFDEAMILYLDGNQKRITICTILTPSGHIICALLF